MLPSVRALLTGAIDYAGLFPPAQLPMPETVVRYRRHAAGGDGWMLARLVVPAARLGELAPLLGKAREGQPPIRLAVLARATELSRDLADVLSFANRHAGQAVVDQLELRLPDPPDQVAAAVEQSLEAIRTRAPGAVPFFEVSLLEGWPERLPRSVDALAAAAAGGAVGLKIRCGGLEASAVPAPQAVAAVLAACRRSGIPLKATQGLHQPVRHFDAGLDTTAHGFLNLFFAGVLGHCHGLSEEELLAMIEEQEPAAFRFHEAGLSWRERPAGLDGIAAARRVAVTSFGSCSFSEPRDALRTLDLLEAGKPARS
jgi:hypothetical protein